MDNPATEPSNSPLNTEQAASVFAEMLNPEQNPEANTEVQDATATAEATAEQPPEEGKAGEADEMVEIDVDGYKIQLPKDKAEKLEADRMRQSDYTKKTMAAAEERKAAHAEAEKALQERQQYAQNLGRMRAQLEGALSEQSQSVNWEQLLQENPQEYLRQKHLHDQRQATLQQVHAEQGRLHQVHQLEQQARLGQHLQQQREHLFAKLPEWKNPEVAQSERKELAEYLVNEGYDRQTVDSITDATAVVLARKAMLYDKLVAKAGAATKKVATLPTKVERPGIGNNPSLDKRSAAFQRLSKSGKVEDAAAVFAGLL